MGIPTEDLQCIASLLADGYLRHRDQLGARLPNLTVPKLRAGHCQVGAVGFFLKVNGIQQYLWPAVDQNGAVIDILVQPKRDRIVAEQLFRKLLQRASRKPKVIVTDKLRSYGAAKRTVCQSIHRQNRYLNNRVENSHQPTRQRERRMKRFKSPKQAQRFLSVFDPIATNFRTHRHRIPAARNRVLR